MLEVINLSIIHPSISSGATAPPVASSLPAITTSSQHHSRIQLKSLIFLIIFNVSVYFIFALYIFQKLQVLFYELVHVNCNIFSCRSLFHQFHLTIYISALFPSVSLSLSLSACRSVAMSLAPSSSILLLLLSLFYCPPTVNNTCRPCPCFFA